MVSKKDSNNQEEKARREKGQATRRFPIPPPHSLRIFFLLHVFLMSVQQFEKISLTTASLYNGVKKEPPTV